MQILGHTFRPFDKEDWETFAAADEGSLIYFPNDNRTVLIWSPKAGTLSKITVDDEGDPSQRDWIFTTVE